MLVQVFCKPSYKGEMTPCRFSLGERSIEAAELVDSWLTLDHRYFKFSGADGATFIPRHEINCGRWKNWSHHDHALRGSDLAVVPFRRRSRRLDYRPQPLSRTGAVREIDWADRQDIVSFDRATIKDGPEYDATQELNREFEEFLHDY